MTRKGFYVHDVADTRCFRKGLHRHHMVYHFFDTEDEAVDYAKRNRRRAGSTYNGYRYWGQATADQSVIWDHRKGAM